MFSHSTPDRPSNSANFQTRTGHQLKFAVKASPPCLRRTKRRKRHPRKKMWTRKTSSHMSGSLLRQIKTQLNSQDQPEDQPEDQCRQTCKIWLRGVFSVTHVGTLFKLCRNKYWIIFNTCSCIIFFAFILLQFLFLQVFYTTIQILFQHVWR